VYEWILEHKTHSQSIMGQNPTLTEGCGEQSSPLINGFEDVMTHIKQQEQRIKELEEKNKKIKEKNNGFEALLRCECGVSIERVIEIKQENKTLKEENKKLKMMIDHLPNDMEDKWWCEKNERWRWDDDGFQEEESEEEPEPPESEEESEEESE